MDTLLCALYSNGKYETVFLRLQSVCHQVVSDDGDKQQFVGTFIWWVSIFESKCQKTSNFKGQYYVIFWVLIMVQNGSQVLRWIKMTGCKESLCDDSSTLLLSLCKAIKSDPT